MNENNNDIILIPTFYQQSGEAEILYLAQYSGVLENSPVITSCIVIK